MRNEQKEYFTTHSKQGLARAKKLEREVDEVVKQQLGSLNARPVREQSYIPFDEAKAEDARVARALPENPKNY